MAPKKMFTTETYLQIGELLMEGKRAHEIAVIVGCTLGSLRVKCSQYGISLMQTKTGRAARSGQIRISIKAVSMVMLEQAAVERKTKAPLFIAAMVEAIVHGNLYKAVLDD